MDTPIAEAPSRMANLDALATQGRGHRIGPGWVPATITGEPHKPAGATLGQIMFIDHLPIATRLTGGASDRDERRLITLEAHANGKQLSAPTRRR